MNIQKIFSRTFDESRLDSLLWTETKRHGPKEFFGEKPDDILDPEYFVCYDGQPRIPQNIGDAFNYGLQGSEIKANFGQYYYNCLPLATYQYLSFNFAKQRNLNGTYDCELATVKGFESLAEGIIDFYRGEQGTPKTRISMRSQNLGIHRDEGWGRNNSFTEHGNAIMADLLSQKRNILRIAGIRDDEHKELEIFLDLIEQKYKSSELIPEVFC